MDLEKIIGANIRRLRKKAGWNQKKLADIYAPYAEEGTCNDKYISLVETGRKWLGSGSFRNFQKIFNVPAEELILIPPSGNVHYILTEKIRKVMEDRERELFLEAVDLFLNYRFLHPEVWDNFKNHLEAMYVTLHKKQIIVTKSSSEIPRK